MQENTQIFWILWEEEYLSLCSENCDKLCQRCKLYRENKHKSINIVSII